MRFRTDQSKHSFSLDPWTGSGLAQDLSQLNHSELRGSSSRQRKGDLLFLLGLHLEGFATAPNANTEPENECDQQSQRREKHKKWVSMTLFEPLYLTMPFSHVSQ